MEDLVRNEETVCPVPDPNKAKINVTNEPSDAHKNPPKKKSWKRSLRNSWRRY
jgi:hypothetical protein